MKEIPKIIITHDPLHKGDKEPYRASIYLEKDNHHGLGETPIQALTRALLHWDKYIANKD